MLITESGIGSVTQPIDLIKRPMENHREIDFGALGFE